MLTVAGSLGLLGCEHWRNGLRGEGGPDSSAGRPADDISVPASQHRPGGRSGLLSPEARDIEKDFNYR